MGAHAALRDSMYKMLSSCAAVSRNGAWGYSAGGHLGLAPMGLLMLFCKSPYEGYAVPEQETELRGEKPDSLAASYVHSHP